MITGKLVEYVRQGRQSARTVTLRTSEHVTPVTTCTEIVDPYGASISILRSASPYGRRISVGLHLSVQVYMEPTEI